MTSNAGSSSQNMAEDTQRHFEFMELPSELRKLVYDDVMGTPGMRCALQQTSKALRKEVEDTPIVEPLLLHMDIGPYTYIIPQGARHVSARIDVLGKTHHVPLREWRKQIPIVQKNAHILKQHTQLDIVIHGSQFEKLESNWHVSERHMHIFFYALCATLAATGLCRSVKLTLSDTQEVLNGLNLEPTLSAIAIFRKHVKLDVQGLPTETKTSFDAGQMVDLPGRSS